VETITNTGTNRVLDVLERDLGPDTTLEGITGDLSIFAIDGLWPYLARTEGIRLILPNDISRVQLLGSEQDRSARNRLNSRWLARRLIELLEAKTELRSAPSEVPQGVVAIRGRDGRPLGALVGSFALDTSGIGLAPGNPLGVIQAAETFEESERFAVHFKEIWDSLPGDGPAQLEMVAALKDIAKLHSPRAVYAQILESLLGEDEGTIREDDVVRSATGIHETHVWKKLYRFQRDGVVGAIDKLNRFGGCIIADSVGLGKTFEALAVIKYHELRNDRVLVLCPKRLRENWTVYRNNDRRNPLAGDRFNYDVLNHTDLSRDRGTSGDIDLSHINWGNYDLVVIDESHNFRNRNATKQGGETRYDKLMRRIVQEGVKTRVLMLSATPVNNRLADLKNQIAFATEGRDHALVQEGIGSIEATTRRAQQGFNKWQQLDDDLRTPERLLASLDFDYFKLLDLLTIARSRRHVEKYYGTDETGTFPDRRPPINVKADIDLKCEFPPIEEINREIRHLHLAAYAPLRYVLPEKRTEYDEKYSTRLRKGKGSFKQLDREQSLIHLMRVNLLKRLESAISSFSQSLERQLAGVETLLDRIDSGSSEISELSITEIDIEDPEFDALLVGNKVKVLLADMDLIKWRQQLTEDRDRLENLLEKTREIDAHRDAKLDRLKAMITDKVDNPINEGNRKLIVFTAFADTAEYLFEQVSSWARDTYGLESALVTGTRQNVTTIEGLRRDLSSVLSAFAPLAKERPADLASDGELDILIATDCVSEGQNLQDCDWVVNYDIHWNPVRIVQRFGRIDRIGSPNEEIQLANFWPNMELDEYINLEQRVSGRMVLLDVSATGEENLIEQKSGDRMNDLAYRRKQLIKLQDTVIDIEDLSAGVSITDLTLGEFRVDLTDFRKENEDSGPCLPLGASTVVASNGEDTPPGIIFCLEGKTEAAAKRVDPAYPLAPYYLVQVSEEGEIIRVFSQVQKTLGALKDLCANANTLDQALASQFDRRTADGRDMTNPQALLAAAFSSLVGRSEERATKSLFSPGGTHVLPGEVAGSEDFEVIAWVAIEESANT
jgi:SNF2 family DNA or RNA helicase